MTAAPEDPARDYEASSNSLSVDGAPEKPKSSTRRTSITQTTAPRSTSYTQARTKAEKVKEAGIEYARKKHLKYFADSTIRDQSEDFPTFAKKQLVLGEVLGKGRFGTVYEVDGITLANTANDEQWEIDERQFIAEHFRRDNGDARYAIKLLSPEVLKDAGLFIQGIYDMSIETRILSDTEHTNIIKARAIAQVSPFQGDEFYIMMDRLYDTLGKRIQKWNKLEKKSKGFFGKMKKKGLKKEDIQIKKVTSAYDLSDALGYLHSRGIIYRDLKPENIGFDIRDDIKLFDFGLATEMKEDRKEGGPHGDTFKLTGMTGSPRYMANEVANEEPYNEKSDVYSFAILFWEMLSTKTPFELYTMKSLSEKVWNGEMKRPSISKDWAPTIKTLLEQMWTPAFRTRPDFPTVTETLRKEIVQLRGGDDEGLEHVKRRSTFVFDKNTDRNALMKMLSVSDLKD